MSAPIPMATDPKEPSARQKAMENMLLQERRFYERKCKEYVQNPSVRIKDTLIESEKRMHQLEEQLAKLNGTTTPTAGDTRDGAETVDGKLKRNRSLLSNSPFGDYVSGNVKPMERRKSSRSSSAEPSDLRSSEPVKLTADVKNKLANICIDDEDYDDTVAEDNTTGPFASLDNLSMKPAHMAVFMQYLVNDGSSASDPAPLFFFLLTGIFQRQAQSGRELKRMARDVAQTFLAGPGKAPLQVDVKASIVEKIQEALEDRNASDDTIRTLFVTARFELAKRVTVQLSAFREMRAIGLSTMFGEFELQDNMTRQVELEIVQKVLGPTLNELSGTDLSGQQQSKLESPISARNVALAMSILTIMEDIGISGSSMKQKKVDRMSSFQSGGKGGSRSLFSRNKSKRQIHMIAGHQFVAKHYNSLTFCDHCHGLLWGLGNQGYNCQVCGFNVHKTSCNTELTGQCPGTAGEHPTVVLRPSQRLGAPPVSPSPSSASGNSIKSPVSPQSQTMAELADVQRQEQVTTKVKEFETRLKAADTNDLRRGGSLRPRGSQLSSSAGAHDYQDERRPSGGASVQRAQSLKLSNERPLRYMHRNSEGSDSSTPASSVRSSSVNDISHVVPDGDGSSVVSTDFEEQNLTSLNDPDLNVDEEFQPWSAMADKKFLKSLSKKEVKRQDLIYELIHTERTHIRKLKVMLYLFYQPLLNTPELLPLRETARSLFPRIEELIGVHCELLAKLRERVNPHSHGTVSYISETISSFFNGDAGTTLKSAAAEWVKLRQENLENLKQLCAKHARFAQFIQAGHANPICNRLQLTDLTSIVMQRLTKYPLLLEGIYRQTTAEVSPRDVKDLPKAIDFARETSQHVNQVVKEYENMKLLQSIQARLDTKDLERVPHQSIVAYRQLDLGLKVLIHNGDLVWKLRRLTLNVHALVVSDLLLLLEHNEDKTRYYLRMRDDFSPVLRLSECLPPREVAIDKKAFFLVNISERGPKMYELGGTTLSERKLWFSIMSKAIQEAKAAAGNTSSPSTSLQSNMLLTQQRRPPLPEQPSDIMEQEADQHLAADESEPSSSSRPRRPQGSTRRTDFGSQLQALDQQITYALEEKTQLVAEYEGYWHDESSGHGHRTETDVHSLLRRCIQQADTVVDLANGLLQPSDDPADKNVMRPSNYQLVDASSKLRGQLGVLTSMVEKREKMVMNMRNEIDILQEQAQRLDGSAPAHSRAENDSPGQASPYPTEEDLLQEQPSFQISLANDDSRSSSPVESSSRPESSDHIESLSQKSGRDSLSIDTSTTEGQQSCQSSADSREEENIAGEED